MKNEFLASTVILSSLAFGGMAHACDMHGGGGFGFGMKNANWQSYSPRASTIDPGLADYEAITPKDTSLAAPAKAKPAFSNAANLAAMKAKSRMAKKTQDKLSDEANIKASVKKASLNTDR